MLSGLFVLQSFSLSTPSSMDGYLGVPETLSSQVEWMLNSPMSEGPDATSAYLHVYVAQDGTLTLLEVYCPSSLLKHYILEKINGKKLSLSDDLPAGHYEFKLRIAAY